MKWYVLYENDMDLKYFINKYPNIEVFQSICLSDDISCEIFKSKNIVVVAKEWYKYKSVLDEKLGHVGKDYIFEWMWEVFLNEKMISYEKIMKVTNRVEKEIQKIICTLSEICKIVYVYGNCQAFSIGSVLMSNDSFRKDYILLVSQPVHRLGNEERTNGLSNVVLEHISVFIYQCVSRNNKYSSKLSDEYIREKLSPKCATIAIPNIYFSGYFPQFVEVKCSPLNDVEKLGNGLIPYGDSLIQNEAESMFLKNAVIGQVMQLYESDFYTPEQVEAHVAKSFYELENRETKCDIKISDFIKENYKKRRLFHAVNHPTTELIMELAQRILGRLGYLSCDTEMLKEIPALDVVEQMIYPCVKKSLNLEFDIRELYLHKQYLPRKIRFKEYFAHYCREYLFMEKADMINNNYDRCCIYDDEYIERKHLVLTQKSGITHLAIRFKARKIIENDIILWIPYKLAPECAFITNCCSVEGEICSASISELGEVRLTMVRYKNVDLIKTDIFCIDTVWINKND